MNLKRAMEEAAAALPSAQCARECANIPGFIPQQSSGSEGLATVAPRPACLRCEGHGIPEPLKRTEDEARVWMCLRCRGSGKEPDRRPEE